MSLQRVSQAAFFSSNSFFSSSVFSRLRPSLVTATSFLPYVLLELLHGVLIDGVGEVEHLEATLLKLLDEGCRLHSLFRLTSDVVDVFLLLLHASNILLEAGHLLARL